MNRSAKLAYAAVACLCLVAAGGCADKAASPAASGTRPPSSAGDESSALLSAGTLSAAELSSAAASTSDPVTNPPTATGTARSSPEISVLTTQKSAPPSTQPGGQSNRRAGVPTRLTIPSLSVVAPVVSVDSSDGVLSPPNSKTELGWWAQGAEPGAATGTAVIVGHSVHAGHGVFNHLDQAKPGARITVVTGAGTLAYSVTGTVVYDKAELPKHAEEVFGQTGPGRLTLISCADYNGSVWTSNIIVYAKPVG